MNKKAEIDPAIYIASSKRVVANRVTRSEVLFAGARELVIKHAGEDYRLRLTNQGKLILTK